jgi:hypothetical protein
VVIENVCNVFLKMIIGNNAVFIIQNVNMLRNVNNVKITFMKIYNLIVIMMIMTHIAINVYCCV